MKISYLLKYFSRSNYSSLVERRYLLAGNVTDLVSKSTINFESTRLLLLTNELNPSPYGGREMLCRLNHDVLSLIFERRLFVFELTTSKPKTVFDLFNVFRGHIDGLSTLSINVAIDLIRRENLTHVFVDGSNLGAFVAVLKRSIPNVEIITFFHNVEARFFWGSWRLHRSVRSLVVFIVNLLSERKSVKFSDKLICLSNRDSLLLKRLYGRAATHVSPIALRDSYPEQQIESEKMMNTQYALFVGGNFYANREGISWFVQNVAPKIDIKICIVGKGMDELRDQLEIPGRVEVYGTVDNLAEWYQHARFVIAPIFDGSGMKTKVAEALMFGKKIIGSTEAFSGYENIIDKVGWCCINASQFIDAIETANNSIQISFDPELRKIYNEYYSLSAAKSRLMEILFDTKE